jgi:hypothetical protein
MSDDEFLIAVTSGILAVAYWGAWLATAAQANPLTRPGRRLTAVVLLLLAALAIVVSTLLTGADPQVRSSPGLIVLFLAVAVDTLALATLAGSALGLSMLDGFVRGRNAAVGWAAAGLWLGTGLVNAGANIGRGDTIYTTLGPLALALGALFVLVGVLSALTRGFRAVRLDRDVPAGIRLAGLFIAWGLYLGRGAAGDWESMGRTLEDFGRYAGAAACLLYGGAIVEAALRPTTRHPERSWLWGIGPAIGYSIPAVVWALI